MSIAVILHVGSMVPLPEILRDLLNLKGTQHDLFVNLVEDKVDATAATNLIRAQYPEAVIVVSENRGMDIGGFFRVLPQVLKGDYEYIFKLHTKSAVNWRRLLMTPLCGNSVNFQHAMSCFVTNPKIGMVGSANCMYREPPNRRPNFYYLKQLTDKLGLAYGKKTTAFIGGTMWICRTSIIAKVFQERNLEELLAEMNSPTTLDPFWYLLQYRDRGVNTVEEAAEHYEKFGKQAGRYCNCLDAREKGAIRYIPDGMIEHAYERLFGLMVEQCGYLLHGI